jgi:hypothetical protein
MSFFLYHEHVKKIIRAFSTMTPSICTFKLPTYHHLLHDKIGFFTIVKPDFLAAKSISLCVDLNVSLLHKFYRVLGDTSSS